MFQKELFNLLIFLFELMDFGSPISLEFRFRKQTDETLGSLIKALVLLIISTSFAFLKSLCRIER